MEFFLLPIVYPYLLPLSPTFLFQLYFLLPFYYFSFPSTSLLTSSFPPIVILGSKALPRSHTHKAPLVVQWSRSLHPVQRIPSGEGSNSGRGRGLSDAYSPPSSIIHTLSTFLSPHLCTQRLKEKKKERTLSVHSTPPGSTTLRHQ